LSRLCHQLLRRLLNSRLRIHLLLCSHTLLNLVVQLLLLPSRSRLLLLQQHSILPSLRRR
jgi:hypothetical protein